MLQWLILFCFVFFIFCLFLIFRSLFIVSPLWRQAKKVGAVEAGGEKVVWRPPSTCPESEGAAGKLERDPSSGTAMAGQGGMASHWKGGNLG